MTSGTRHAVEMLFPINFSSFSRVISCQAQLPVVIPRAISHWTPHSILSSSRMLCTRPSWATWYILVEVLESGKDAVAEKPCDALLLDVGTVPLLLEVVGSETLSPNDCDVRIFVFSLWILFNNHLRTLCGVFQDVAKWSSGPLHVLGENVSQQ